MTEITHHLVTGANGYVGSNLVRALLAQGYRVTALARCNATTLTAALNNAVVAEGAAMSATEIQRLSLWQYRLDRDDLGLADTHRLDERICCWHSAAFMSFSSLALQESWDANVHGTQRLCNWFRRHAPKGSRFHHLSTAYTCGRLDTNLSERFYPDQDLSAFHNPYEYTKRNAEFVVRAFAKQTQTPTLVLRLGQIVGMSTSGATTSDLGVYGLFRLVNQLRLQGVEHTWLGARTDAHLHLVPVDACIASLMRLRNTPENLSCNPQVIHLVPSQPVLLTEILASLKRQCGVTVELYEPADGNPIRLGRIDKVVARQLRDVLAYVHRTYHFEHRPRAHFSACDLNLSGKALEQNVSHYLHHLQHRL